MQTAYPQITLCFVPSSIPRRGRKRLRSGLGGFSFAEVMFAIVILGIGFIMVASVFPVALEQTRSNADENRANQLVVSCVQGITSTINTVDYPDTGGTLQAFSSQPNLWSKVSNTMIDSADPRYACVPFFWKSPVDGSVRITVIAVRRWIHDSYSAADFTQGELVPRGLSNVSVSIQGDGTQTVQIGKDLPGMYQSVTNDTFLILTSGDGDVNGRVLRVAQKLSEDANYVTWGLRSDGGLAAGDSCSNAYAAVIGRDWVDPANPDSGYQGPSQDLAVYTTFLGASASH